LRNGRRWEKRKKEEEEEKKTKKEKKGEGRERGPVALHAKRNKSLSNATSNFHDTHEQAENCQKILQT
jgi:hypothetical protein